MIRGTRCENRNCVSLVYDRRKRVKMYLVISYRLYIFEILYCQFLLFFRIIQPFSSRSWLPLPSLAKRFYQNKLILKSIRYIFTCLCWPCHFRLNLKYHKVSKWWFVSVRWGYFTNIKFHFLTHREIWRTTRI